MPILLLFVVILGASGYLLINLKQQEAVITTQEEKIQKLNSLNEKLSRDEDVTEYYVLAYRFNQERSFLLTISQAALDKSKTLDEMYPFITTPYGRELVEGYINARKNIETLRNDLLKAIDGGNQDQITLSYNKWNIQVQNIKATLSDIKAYNINSLEGTLTSVQNIGNKIVQIIIILTLVISSIIVFLYFYLRVIITIPIIKLSQFADEIANKNFTTTTTTTTTRKDELGTLSRAFNTMSGKLKESYTTLEQKVRDRTQDLEGAKAKDEAILSNLGEGIAVTDETGKLIYFNKAAEQITGVGMAQGLPDTWQKEYGTFYPDTITPLPTELQPLVLALEGKTVFDVPLFLRNKKIPEGKFISVTATPVLQDGKKIGGVAIFRDMTKERKIDKVKTEFVSLASHQLRTPTTSIRWYAEMLLGEKEVGTLNETQRKYLREIYRSDRRMIDLVNSLLNVSRIELGTFGPQQRQTDIMKVMSSILQDLSIQISEKKVVIQYDPKPHVLNIQTDPQLLRIVLSNLITNAIEYTQKDGTISCAVTQVDDVIQITISDTGCGIPYDEQSNIFTKFFRADNARIIKPDGNGLGLYITKSIIESLGGSISFTSSEGVGTIFTVVMPKVV